MSASSDARSNVPNNWADLEIVLIVESPDGETSSAVAQVDGDELRWDAGAEPIVVPVSAAPLQIAFFVALGPRPRPAEDAQIVATAPLADPSRATLLATVPPDDRAGTPLASDELMVWTAAATWLVNETEYVRIVSVADAGDDGIALLENDADGLLVRPCTSTDVWLRLADLLPYGFELAGESPAAS